VPHVPLALQICEQHSALFEQAVPSGEHEPQVCPQIVFTSLTHKPSHDVVQQNGSVMQIDATHGPQLCESGGPMSHTSCEHDSMQAPFEHFCEQHCVSLEQDEPIGLHGPCPQILLVHKPLQHSNGALQNCPSGKHGPLPQMLLLQIPLQHSNPCLQSKPSGKHGPPPHTPPLQIPLQHSNPCLHPKPSGKHIPKPHVLLLQIPLQHDDGSTQNEPSG